MLKISALSVASIAALSVSAAFAQVPTAGAQTGPTPAQAQPAPAQPGAAVPGATDPTGAAPGAAEPTTGTTAQAAPSSAAPAGNANAQVVAVVEAGFPKYDVDKDGKLSEAEFKQWISDLKTQEMTAQGKPADPAAVSQYASAALAAADKDKDGVISKQDLTTFLGG